MLSQLPWSYLRVFPPFCSVRICFANPHLRPAQFFNLIRVATKIYASHVTPPSTQSASPIHNSIGRAFSCTVALELSNPPFAYAVLAKSFSPIEKLPSCSFLRQNVFCHQETFVVFNLLPPRQTLPRHTGTPPVSQK